MAATKAAAARRHANLGFAFSCIDFSRLGAVGGADDAVSFHLLDHSSRTVVSYPQSSLNHRYRSLLGFGDDGDRLIVHLVVFLIRRQRRLDFLLCFEDFRTVAGPPLLFDELHYPPDLLIRHKSAVDAEQSRRPWRHKEQIAVAEKLFAAH